MIAGRRSRRRQGVRAPWANPASAAVGFYLLARLWQLVMMGKAIVTPDTPMYRSAGQGWLDFTPVSFSGTDIRPWPVTLLYATVPTDRWRVLAQFAVATCSWAYCIFQFRHLARHRVLGPAGPLLVATLALTIGISGFDVVLLSESLALSLVAVYVGGILSLCLDRLRVATMVATLTAASMLGLLRPVLVPLIACVPLIPCLRWLREHRRGHVRPRLAAFGAATLVLAGMSMSYAWIYNVRADRTWGDWIGAPGLNGRTLTQYYLAAYHTPSGPELIRAMIDAGAPACLYHPSPVEGFTDDHVAIDRERCPQGLPWLSRRFLPTLSGYLATHPGAARRYFGDALADASSLRTDGAPSLPTPVPGPVTSLFFADRAGAGDPLVLWSILALGAVVARWHRLRFRRPVRNEAAAILAATSVVAYLALLGTAILSASDASRVALPLTALLRLVLTAVIVRAAAGALAGRAPERAPIPSGPCAAASGGISAAGE